jgi:shikimate dehydrogenase
MSPSPKIQATTSVYMVIGDPIAHSLSPRMHNAAYQACGIDSVMVAARVSAAFLESAVAGVRALNIRGLACTMPHKAALCSLVDTLDPVAKAIGAVNTVVNNDGALTGYNTDWLGIQRPLEKRLALNGRRVALLGAGGAAAAALYACGMRGALVTVFNRTESKAQALASQYGASWSGLDATCDLAQFDIVINTTSLGMSQSIEASPLTASQLHRHQVVFETIYSPRKTRLLSYAEQAGCQIVYGSEMFVEQGAAQFEIHTGALAPREVMWAVVDDGESASG